MRYLSVCSGIEAASVAWHGLGWTPAAFSEIEKFPSAVLAHHYPDVRNLGDMTKFKEWPDDLAPNVLVGGTPCQSFSVAGLRKGLADPRGNLALTYLALADRYRPEWLVWENVPGVLSSDGGRDFGSFLGGLGQLGYGFAYRVLDAQFFGVAQRRRRVFVVANARDWRRAAAVLFERESLRGDPPPSREAREGLAIGALAGTSPGGGWRVGADEAAAGQLIPGQVVSSIDASLGRLQGCSGQDARHGHSHLVPLAYGGNNTAGPIDVATACNASASASGRLDFESETFIAHTLRADGFDASEDGTGRGTPLVPVTWQGGSQQDCIVNPDDVAPTLAFASGTHGGHHQPKVLDRPVAFVPQAGGAQTTLGFDPESGTAPTLSSNQTPAIAFAQNQLDEVRTMDVAGALAAEPGAKQQTYMQQGMAVRRLTPRECERLQGFPDDYTDIRPRGKDTPDGPRYKALGNSMAVPVMAWIGKRIQQVSEQ